MHIYLHSYYYAATHRLIIAKSLIYGKLKPKVKFISCSYMHQFCNSYIKFSITACMGYNNQPCMQGTFYGENYASIKIAANVGGMANLLLHACVCI